MKPTLLLDLDDTLIKNDIDAFLPQYLQAFSAHVANHLNPDVFVRSLMAGTRAMVENRLPDRTLKETFESVFYPLTEADPVKFQELADGFYETIFPSLNKYTAPIPEARDLVRRAQGRGYQLAIATNPLFPRQAIDHRLSWANLPSSEFRFDLVTSYESFHFSKPDPAFLAEVMGRLGWPEGPVVVVGDDCERDINPAGKLGLAAYCVNSQLVAVQVDDGQLVKSGNLEDLLSWIDDSPVGSLKPVYSRPSSWLAQVRATPAIVDSFCRALPQDRWCQRPAEKEWCLTEILCHLRDVDLEVNLARLRKFSENENPFLAGQDTDPWSETRQYYLQDGQQALRDFFTARQELVALLGSLTPEDWHRPARHAIFGPTRLQELVNILVAHDRLHVQQIRQLLERISPNLPIL